jgi:hypothetical protein
MPPNEERNEENLQMEQSYATRITYLSLSATAAITWPNHLVALRFGIHLTQAAALVIK